MITTTAKLDLAKLKDAKVLKKDDRIFIEITHCPLYHGKNGAIYLDIACHDKPNDYGDDGFITQGLSKEARQNGEKGPILGNWRHFTARNNSPEQEPSQRKSPPLAPAETDDDIPF